MVVLFHTDPLVVGHPGVHLDGVGLEDHGLDGPVVRLHDLLLGLDLRRFSLANANTPPKTWDNNHLHHVLGARVPVLDQLEDAGSAGILEDLKVGVQGVGLDRVKGRLESYEEVVDSGWVDGQGDMHGNRRGGHFVWNEGQLGSFGCSVACNC